MSVSHRNRNPPRSESPLGVSVVIATLDRPESLTETIASVAACVPLPDEIVIVDGDGGSSARAVAEAWSRPGAGLPVRYLASPPGLTRQRNAGLAVARAEIVLFLDDDVTIPPHAVATLLAAYEDPEVVGVTGRIVGDRSQLVNRESRLRRFLPGGGREGSFTRFGYPRYIERVTEPHDVEYMHGCFMSARRDLAGRGRVRRAADGVRSGRRRGLLVPAVAARSHPLHAGDRRRAPSRAARRLGVTRVEPDARRQPRVPVPQELRPDARRPGAVRAPRRSARRASDRGTRPGRRARHRGRRSGRTP